MIERIEGTFYCIDPETKESTCEIKFHVDEEHSEQWDVSKMTMIKEDTYELLIRLQRVVQQFNQNRLASHDVPDGHKGL